MSKLKGWLGNTRVRTVLAAGLGLAIFVWFAWLFYQDREVWAAQLHTVNWSVLTLSLLVLLTVYVLQALIWRQLLFDFGYRLSFNHTIQTLYIAGLGRYVPGRIWQISAAMYLLRQLGIPVQTSATVSIVAQLITIVAGIIVGLPILFLWLFSNEIAATLLVSILMVATLFVFVTFGSVWWMRIVNQLLKRTGRAPIELGLSPLQIGKYLLLYLIVWVDSGFAFYLLFSSIYPLDIRVLPLCIAASAFGYVIGYLVILAPGGIGVREGTLVFALSLFVAAPIAGLVALLSRVWLMSMEVGLSLIAMGLYSLEHFRSKTNQ